MINIDGVFYKGNLQKTKIQINDKWEDILVLDIDVDLENINIIKHQDKIYKIDKIINRFEDNKKWLTYLYEGPDIDKIQSNKTIKKLKEENEMLELALMEMALANEERIEETELAIAELTNLIGEVL